VTKVNLQQLLAPSTRLMGRLRFFNKLLVVGVLFAVALAGLSATVIIRLNSELATTLNEEKGIEVLPAAADLMRSIAESRQVYNRGAVNADYDDVAQAKADADLTAAFDAIDAWIGADEDRAALGESMSGLRSDWAALRQGRTETKPSLVLNQYADLASSMLSWIEDVADWSSLALDPERTTYYLMDAAVFQIPSMSEQAAAMRETGYGVSMSGLMYANERAALNSQAFSVSQSAARLGRDLSRILSDLSGDRQARLEAAFNATAEATAPVLTTVNNGLLNTDEINVDPDAYYAKATAMLDASWSLYAVASSTLAQELEARVDALSRFRALTIVTCVLTLAVTFYLFAGLSRSLGDALASIQSSVKRMAEGDFPERVDVESTDEMRTVADSVESMAGTLRRFSAAQTQIFERHLAGEVSFRIDAKQFSGAYADMAGAVNQLAAEHIGTSDRVVSIIEQYAQGNLADQIEPMPGEMARISSAVDGVREKLGAIRDEILMLSAAAAQGEFGQRGDANRFAFAYREMVEGLNRLMENAERGLDEVGNVLSGLAEGDLTRSMNGDFQGRFATLRDDANRTVAQLASIVAEIKSSSGSIDSAAKEISRGNSDLSARTESQAASLEETASSVEEMTATVRQNAESAQQANQLALGAAEVATRGGTVVGQVVSTMSEIRDSSRRIADIIGTIDGIAFQTNILALNAAVEAARAGEQGRGFAVVASEVRNLAQRSAGAAREIKTLIEESVNRVEVGSQLVDSAGKTMAEIVTSVRRVTDIIGDISSASSEQASGIEQINQTVTQMDETTQQNAALVEQASAAARSMEEMARQLWESMTQFRLEGDARRARPAAHGLSTAGLRTARRARTRASPDSAGTNHGRQSPGANAESPGRERQQRRDQQRCRAFTQVHGEQGGHHRRAQRLPRPTHRRLQSACGGRTVPGSRTDDVACDRRLVHAETHAAQPHAPEHGRMTRVGGQKRQQQQPRHADRHADRAE